MMQRVKFVGFAISATIGTAMAAPPPRVQVIHTERQSFLNSDCEKTGTCDLKSFDIQVDSFRVNVENYPTPSYLKRVTARYRTDHHDHLEKYGIAQFIRGCVYQSKVVDGEVVKSLNVLTPHYGKNVTFRHPRRVIDGFLPDPISWGFDPGFERHHFYYGNSVAGSTAQATEKRFGSEWPASPELYVKDRPGGTAFYDPTSGIAKNISLDLRLCVYRTADVPKSVPADRLDFATPLQCFDWQVHLVYDHTAGKMTSPATIDSFCVD